MSTRYAIYYAPAQGSLTWQAGCRWLGRDAATGAMLEQPAVPGLTHDEVRRLTASARMYGLHATLKPPFHLADGSSASALERALSAFAAARAPIPNLGVQVAQLAGFLALQPAAPNPALMRLADECVVHFDQFRRPAGEAELARRRANGLGARQEALLARYGYPYVLDQFRFHITLTDRLAPEELAALQPWLSRYFSDAMRVPLTLDDICLFVQDGPGAPFRLASRHPLQGG